jgi:hypothetical protein
MPEKKAAKKASKKGAKKGAKHQEKHHEGKDLRKAYEHLGRLSVLEPSLTVAVVAQIKMLTELAQVCLRAEETKSAADLLRAGEHLAFGSLAANTKAMKLSEELEGVLNAEYERLVDKAEEHWGKHEGERAAAVEEMYQMMVSAADGALHTGAYRRAIEFARGAEALTHVRGGSGVMLEDGGKKAKKLKG